MAGKRLNSDDVNAILEGVGRKINLHENEEVIGESMTVLSENVSMAIEESINNESIVEFVEKILFETSIVALEAKEKEEEDEDDDEDKKKDDSDEDDDEDGDDNSDDDDDEDDDEDGEPIEERKGKKKSKKKCVKESSYILTENTDMSTFNVKRAITEGQNFKDKMKDKWAKFKKWLEEAWNTLKAFFGRVGDKFTDLILQLFRKYDKIRKNLDGVRAGLPKIQDVQVRGYDYANLKPSELNVSVSDKFWSAMVSGCSKEGATLVRLADVKAMNEGIEKLADIQIKPIIKAAIDEAVKSATGKDGNPKTAFIEYFRGSAISTVAEFTKKNDVIGIIKDENLAKSVCGKAQTELKGIKEASKAMIKEIKIELNDKGESALKRIDMVTRQGADLQFKKVSALLSSFNSRLALAFRIANAALNAAGGETKSGTTNLIEGMGSFNLNDLI